MRLVPLLLRITLVSTSYSHAFDASILSSKNLTAGVLNAIPVCYTADVPAVLTISRTMTAGATFDYPIALEPVLGSGVGNVIDVNTVDVPANTTPYGALCDGSVASAVAFKYIFNAPDGSTMATVEGKAAGTYSTEVTISITAK